VSIFRKPFLFLLQAITAWMPPNITDPYSTAAARTGIRRYTAKQLGMQSRKCTTVAAEKRKARKRRNRLRHKARVSGRKRA
jgi:hypothetical protein